jgi:hypothetical protein
MEETRFSDESNPNLLRFSYVKAEAFSQMHPVWRALKLEELGVVESLWDAGQSEACLARAEKWAKAYWEIADLALAPVPLELTDSFHKKLVRGCPGTDREPLLRLGAIMRGIVDRFETRRLLAALERDLQLCKACGPIAIFVNSELEVVSANGLALKHFGGARPALMQLAPTLQREVTQGLRDRTYASFRHSDLNEGQWDATIVPWQGSLQGIMLGLERPRQLRRGHLEPATRFLESCVESLRTIFHRWQHDLDSAKLGLQLEDLHRRLRSDYYAKMISGLARSAGPASSTDLTYHAAHVLLRGLGNAFLPYTLPQAIYANEPEFTMRISDEAALSFSWALRLIQLILDLLESLACEGGLEGGRFATARAVTAAFDGLKSLDLTGTVGFRLEGASSGPGEHHLVGDGRLIERACFGILYELLYHRNSGSVTVGFTREAVEGKEGVRIEFQDHPEHHDALHAAGFTGFVLAEKIVRAHRGRLLISRSRKDDSPQPRRISIWIPDSP